MGYYLYTGNHLAFHHSLVIAKGCKLDGVSLMDAPESLFINAQHPILKGSHDGVGFFSFWHGYAASGCLGGDHQGRIPAIGQFVFELENTDISPGNIDDVTPSTLSGKAFIFGKLRDALRK